MKTTTPNNKNRIIHFILAMLFTVILASFCEIGGGLYAQDPDMTSNVWFANSLTINNQTTQAPRTPEMRIQVYFDNNEMLSEMCCAGQMELDLIYDNAQSTFEINNILTTTQTCPDSKNNNFRNLYVDFFQNNSTDEFEYDIQTIMAGFGEYKILTISNIAGDTIDFFNSPHDPQMDYYVFDPSQTHWYLVFMSVNGTHHFLSYATAQQTSITFSRDGSFHSEICDEIVSTAGFINDVGGGPFGSGEFYILCEDLSITPRNCNDTALTDIEQHYFNFLQNLANGNIAFYQRSHADFADFCGAVEIIDIYDTSTNSSITLVDCLEPLSTRSFNLLQSFTVYPNPATDIVYIKSRKGSNILSLEILDINGKTIKKYNASQNEINIAELKAGLYFLRINNDKNIVTKKIVKK